MYTKKVPMILLVTLVSSLVGSDGICDEAALMVLIALLFCYLIQISSVMFGISGFRWCRKYGAVSKAGVIGSFLCYIMFCKEVQMNPRKQPKER